MECKFVVGQDVICIRDDWEDKPDSYPRKGNVYRIIGIDTGPQRTTGKIDIGLRFVEFPYQNIWHHENFRPVQEKLTERGMEILRKLLDPANHKTIKEPLHSVKGE